MIRRLQITDSRYSAFRKKPADAGFFMAKISTQLLKLYRHAPIVKAIVEVIAVVTQKDTQK
ncbi:MAG: hypothetical protein ACI91G_000866 [Gammaproteobacteria bacterium]|jgi:hypothetical protein